MNAISGLCNVAHVHVEILHQREKENCQWRDTTESRTGVIDLLNLKAASWVASEMKG